MTVSARRAPLKHKKSLWYTGAPPSDKSAACFLVINKESHSLRELSVASRFHVLRASLQDTEDACVIASGIGVNVLDDYEDETACDVRLRIFPLGSLPSDKSALNLI